MAYLDSLDAIFKFVSLLLIEIVAFVGNILILVAGLRCKQLRKASNAFIFNVATADLLQSIFIMPFTLVPVYFDRWPLDFKMCQIVGLLKVIITLASVQSLAGISLDRYMYIVRRQDTITTKWRLTFSIVVVWTTSTALAVSPMFGWGELGFDDGKETCTILYYKNLSYTLVVFCTGLLIPVLVMAFCYFKIFSVLHLQRLKIQNTKVIDYELEKTKESCSPNVENRPIPLIENSHRGARGQTTSKLGNEDPSSKRCGEGESVSSGTMAEKKGFTKNVTKKHAGGRILTAKEYQLLKTVIIVILVFLACWFPYVVFNTLRTTGAVKDNNTMDTINMWMGFANSAFNPLLYGLTNHQFRTAIKRLF